MAASVSDSYTIPGALNFKRIKSQGASTTIETKSSPTQPSRLMEQMRRFKCIENFIKHKLYHKYAASQNYYYLRDINSILNDERTLAVIEYKDGLSMQTKDEHLKKLYRLKEYKGQIPKLTEYYKYHKEIPRIFAKEVYDAFFDHHDQKRKVEFVVITKKLREEAGEDVKGELEQQLKKMRDSKYQPILADLKPYVATGYKTKQMNDSRTPQNNQSQSGFSLQQKLNIIFSNQLDMSLSQFSIKSGYEDNELMFTKHLKSSASAKDIPAIQPQLVFKKKVIPEVGVTANLGKAQTGGQPGVQAKGLMKSSKPQNPLMVVDVRAEAEYNPRGGNVAGSPVKHTGRTVGSSSQNAKFSDDRMIKLVGSNGNSNLPSREMSRQGSITNLPGKGGPQSLTSTRQLSIGHLGGNGGAVGPPNSTAKFVNSVIRASLSPEIVASLKKIQLPGDEPMKHKNLMSNQMLQSGPTSPGMSIKPVPLMGKVMSSTVLGSNTQDTGLGSSQLPKGATHGFHSRTSSQVSKVLAEGSQVSIGATSLAKKQSSGGPGQLTNSASSQILKRGITQVRHLEEATDLSSALRNSSGGFKREGSDFRITKKTSMEEPKMSPSVKGPSSKRNNGQAYLFSEKDQIVGLGEEIITSQPITLDLMGGTSQQFTNRRAPSLNKLNYDGKSGGAPLTTVAKHQKQNSLNGPSMYSAGRVAPSSSRLTQANFDIAGSIYGSGSAIQKAATQLPASSSRQMPGSSHLEAVNFKMNIDRLIRASGAIDFKTVTQGASSGFTIGQNQMSQTGSISHHSHHKSQINAYQNFLHPSKPEGEPKAIHKHAHSKSQPLGSSRESSAAASSSRVGSQVLLVKTSPSLHQAGNLMSGGMHPSLGNSTQRLTQEPRPVNRGLSSAHKIQNMQGGESSTTKINISKGALLWAGEDSENRKYLARNTSTGSGIVLDGKNSASTAAQQHTVSKEPFAKKISISEYSAPARQGTSGTGMGTARTGAYLGGIISEERPAYAKKEIKLVKKASHQKTGSTKF